MAAINANSAQVAAGLAFPVVKLNPWDYYGRSRKVRFSYVTTGNEGIGSIITLAQLPPNAKVTGGQFVCGALGSSVTSSIGLVNGFGSPSNGTLAGGTGVAGTGTEFLSAAATATAGATPFANTLALNYGYLIANPPAANLNQANVQPLLGDTLIWTTGGATLAASIIVEGHIDIIVD